MAKAEAALRPIDRQLLAVKLAQTIELWATPDNWSKVAGFYLEALDDLPPDVVDNALKQARRKCKWLPKPSEIRAFAEDEMQHRHRAIAHARQAIRTFNENATPPVDIAQRKRVGEMLGGLVQQLRSGPEDEP